MRHIHSSILRVLEEFRRLRGQLVKAKLEASSRHRCLVPQVLPYPALVDGKNVDLQPLPSDMTPVTHELSHMVWVFLKNLRVNPPEAGTQGVTWLELLIHFENLGGRVFSEEGTPSTPKHTTKATLTKFKAEFRRVVALCVGGPDALLFRPCKLARPLRLGCLGALQHQPCLAFLPCWAGEVARKVMHGLVSLRVRPTRKLVESIDSSTLWLRTGRLSLRGCPPWRQLAYATSFLPSRVGALRGKEPEPTPCRPSSFFLQCPGCERWRDVHALKLLTRGSWGKVRCGHCRGLHVAKKWKCVCHEHWNTCTIHGTVGKQCGPPPKNARSRFVKRRPSDALILDKEGFPLPKRTKQDTHSRGIVAHEVPPALFDRLTEDRAAKAPTELSSGSTPRLARPPLPWPRPPLGKTNAAYVFPTGVGENECRIRFPHDLKKWPRPRPPSPSRPEPLPPLPPRPRRGAKRKAQQEHLDAIDAVRRMREARARSG